MNQEGIEKQTENAKQSVLAQNQRIEKTKKEASLNDLGIILEKEKTFPINKKSQEQYRITKDNDKSPFHKINYEAPQNILSLESQIAVHQIFEWKAELGRLEKFSLVLNNKTISIRQMTKIKCLSEEAIGKKRKIKISINEVQDFFFATDVEKLKFGFPLHYAWYAKLVCSKLVQMGYDLDQPHVGNIKQFPTPIEKHFCRGFIHKRSQYLKTWQKRYIIINTDGLFSFKNPNQAPSFSIKSSSMKYFWTRFEIYEEFLIIKLKHGMDKTQFAIPIFNYCRKNEENWLYGFYRMLMQKYIIRALD